MTQINDCLHRKVNDINRSKFCKTTVVNCRCVQNPNRENNIECFWGCEDKKSGDWMYYSTSKSRKPKVNNNIFTVVQKLHKLLNQGLKW